MKVRLLNRDGKITLLDNVSIVELDECDRVRLINAGYKYLDRNTDGMWLSHSPLSDKQVKEFETLTYRAMILNSIDLTSFGIRFSTT